jgi:hypothetical protein
VPGARRRIVDEHDRIHFAQRLDRRIDHPHIHPVQRPVNARRIDERNLSAWVVLGPEDPRPRRLRLVGHDGDLLADDPVEERRLSRIGAANNRNVASSQDRGSGMGERGSGIGDRDSGCKIRDSGCTIRDSGSAIGD